MTINKWLSVTLAIVAGIGLAAGRAALAQDESKPTLVVPAGMAAFIGGGGTGFAYSGAMDAAHPGGEWEGRFVIGTRSNIAGEIAYLGSAQGMKALGVENTAYLMSNGLEGNLRLNFLTGIIQPYVSAGLGYRHYSMQGTSFNTSSVASSDNVGEIPLAVGLAFRYKGFVAELRGAYNASFVSALIPNTPLSTWNADARVGWEF